MVGRIMFMDCRWIFTVCKLVHDLRSYLRQLGRTLKLIFNPGFNRYVQDALLIYVERFIVISFAKPGQ